MVTIIANQKRTIAVDGSDIPCTFDPLDGNAKEWLHDLFTLPNDIPCVYNWLYLELEVNDFSGTFTAYDVTVTYYDDTTDTFSFNPNNSVTTYGTGWNELATQVSTFGMEKFLMMHIPIWKRGLKQVNGSFLANCSQLKFHAQPGRLDGLNYGHYFFNETATFDQVTAIFDYEVLIAPTGRVYRV